MTLGRRGILGRVVAAITAGAVVDPKAVTNELVGNATAFDFRAMAGYKAAQEKAAADMMYGDVSPTMPSEPLLSKAHRNFKRALFSRKLTVEDVVTLRYLIDDHYMMRETAMREMELRYAALPSMSNVVKAHHMRLEMARYDDVISQLEQTIRESQDEIENGENIFGQNRLWKNSSAMPMPVPISGSMGRGRR